MLSETAAMDGRTVDCGGLTAWFRRRLPPGAYVGIELEVNQKHVVRAGRYWTAMRKVIVEALCRALANRCAGISA
jgi:hypothetical protein